MTEKERTDTFAKQHGDRHGPWTVEQAVDNSRDVAKLIAREGAKVWGSDREFASAKETMATVREALRGRRRGLLPK